MAQGGTHLPIQGEASGGDGRPCTVDQHARVLAGQSEPTRPAWERNGVLAVGSHGQLPRVCPSDSRRSSGEPNKAPHGAALRAHARIRECARAYPRIRPGTHRNRQSYDRRAFRNFRSHSGASGTRGMAATPRASAKTYAIAISCARQDFAKPTLPQRCMWSVLCAGVSFIRPRIVNRKNAAAARDFVAMSQSPPRVGVKRPLPSDDAAGGTVALVDGEIAAPSKPVGSLARIGISARVADVRPVVLTGTLKFQPFDFLVREVEAGTGSIVRLLNTRPDVPAPPAAPSGEDGGREGALSAIVAALHLPPDAAEAARIRVWLMAACADGGATGDAGAPDTLTIPLCSEVTKADRGVLHQTIRRHWGPSSGASPGDAVHSDAVPGEAGTTCFRLRRGGGGGGGGGAGGGGDGGQRWPADRLPFLRFVLHKQDVDTRAAIAALSKATRIRERNFGTAGIKDRRAITTQHVTLHHAEPKRIFRAAAAVRGVTLGGFEYVQHVSA